MGSLFDASVHIVHYAFHFVVPVLFARLFWRRHWKTAAIIMLATMLIDVDHLLATPIYDAERCSLGFHPLHTVWAGGVYLLLFSVPSWRVRAVATGCIWHLATDGLVCLSQRV